MNKKPYVYFFRSNSNEIEFFFRREKYTSHQGQDATTKIGTQLPIHLDWLIFEIFSPPRDILPNYAILPTQQP